MTYKTISKIQSFVNNLDKNKIHLIYFSYKSNYHNFYHSTLLSTTKILSLLTRKPAIDHVTHISRFVKDEETGNCMPRIFEASVRNGMLENDLLEKLKNFEGKIWIETIDKIVDKTAAKSFELKFLGTPYSKKMAFFAGVDFKLLDKFITVKKDGGFCSWLVTLFLKSQNIILKTEKGNELEIIPSQIFQANLGVKSYFKV